jgi:hypothetical protein
MALKQYVWRPSGHTLRCRCGGRLEHLVVDPPRSKKYLNEIMLCANKDCRRLLQMVD